MAYFTQLTARTDSPVERVRMTVSNTLQSVSKRVATYRLYRQTYNELAKLNNRDLEDLGMSRSGIQSLAWETAQRNKG